MTTHPKPTGYRALLALAVPKRLALASIPADFADWLDYAAIVGLLVFTWGEGPLVLALFAFCLTLPYVAVGPLLAMVVDRTPLRRVLVLSNLGRGLATLALVFAPSWPVVLAIVAIRACIDSAFGPARQAAIQASTPTELLASANGLHQAINQTSKIAGPALGGVLLAVIPAQTVFGLNAILSLVATALVFSLALPPKPPREPSNFREEVLAGAAEFRRSPLMLTALVFSAVAYFSFFLYDALIGLLAADFELGATAFGIGIAASGAGGLVGALLSGLSAQRHPIPNMVLAGIVAGAAAAGLGIVALRGVNLAAPFYFLVLALMGGSTSFMLVPYRTIVQSKAPPDRIARVVAAGEAVTMAVMLSAPFAGSLVAYAYGTGAAFLAGGILLIALGVVTAIGAILGGPKT
jgi:predicted MFS family arabinose efflux permease